MHRYQTVFLKRIETPVIDRIVSNDFTLTIHTSQIGEFEYSLDGVSYQKQNVFYEYSEWDL